VRKLVGILAIISVAIVSCCITASAEESMKCNNGPIDKTIGGTAWLGYLCEDDKSLVFVTQKDNPASPFVFMLMVVDGEYRLHGEGNGAKIYTKLAYEELKDYSWEDKNQVIVKIKQSLQQLQQVENDAEKPNVVKK